MDDHEVHHLELYYDQRIEDLKAQLAEKDKVIEVALDEAYQNEVVDTDMEHIVIGGEYLNKDDWKESKEYAWEEEAKAKDGE